MLRTRLIRPGIAHNEELGKLGPVTELVFIRLWMLADREGRLEDNPSKIKFEALPAQNHITVEAVEKSVENLWKSGFIKRYKMHDKSVNGDDSHVKRYIAITNFTKHQNINPHEAESKIPPPPSGGKQTTKKAKNADARSGKQMREHARSAVQMNAHECSPSNLVTSNLIPANARAREIACAREAPAEEAPVAPPVEKPKPKPQPLQPPPGPPPVRRPPQREDEPPRKNQPVDMWPHKADDVALVRASLNELAQLVHLPPPDDGIIRRVLDASNGAPAAQIHGVLRELWFQKRFRDMRSWGLIPVVLAPWFATARAG